MLAQLWQAAHVINFVPFTNNRLIHITSNEAVFKELLSQLLSHKNMHSEKIVNNLNFTYTLFSTIGEKKNPVILYMNYQFGIKSIKTKNQFRLFTLLWVCSKPSSFVQTCGNT